MDLTPDTWADVLALLGVVAAFLGVLDWRIKAHVTSKTDDVRAQLLDAIELRTRPVQAGYRNNGESLADIAHQLARIESR